MDKPPGAEGCLPLTSGCPPRRIPRPERYEVDDTPLSPPSSSYLLFDSSSVFNSHPHKYRLLINKPSNGSQETPPVSSSSENGHKPLRHRRSKSLVSLPQLEDSKITSTSAISHDDESSNDTITSSAVCDDHLLRPKKLPLRKISDSTIPTLRSSSSASDILFGHGNYSREKPEEGEDKVLRNFSDAVSLQEDRPVNFQIQPFEDFNDRMNSGSDASGKSKPSLPVSDGTSAKYVVKEVQPEPRRLFGFGPLYRPLPETVLERQETAPTSITEKVKQTGLTAVGTDSIDAGGTAQRKTSKVDNKQGEISKTTKRETSMWMPFSF